MSLSRIEKISHYAVVVIAISALFVSIWQGRVLQKHNRLSVKPYMDFHINQGNQELRVEFSNEGLGPAIMKKATYTFEGKTYDTITKVLQAAGEVENVIDMYTYNPNSVFSSGDHHLLVKLKGNHVRGIFMKMTYETIYQDEEVFEFRF